MKKIITIMLLVLTLTLSAIGLTACGKGETDNETGLLVTKHRGDNYYTVYGFVEEEGKTTTKLDIGALAKDGQVIGRIKANSFAGNQNIKEIIVPDTVQIIDEGAFAGIKNLEKITIPYVGRTAKADGLVGETESAKDKSYNAQRNFGFIFGEEEYDYSAKIEQNYNSASKVAFYFPLKLKEVVVNASKDYTVPAYAFSGITLLRKITLSEKVNVIGEYAFAGCQQLTSIAYKSGNTEEIGLSASVTKLHRGAFSGCKNLLDTGFKFNADNKITVLGIQTFSATGLSVVKLPDNIVEIGADCFRTSTVKTIETKATKIGSSAFNGCDELVSFNSTTANEINLANVTEIGGLAFANLNEDITFSVKNVAGGLDTANIFRGSMFN